MKYYFDALKNFANFRGRATRKEYWMFFLINLFFGLIAFSLDFLIAGFSYGFDLLFENLPAMLIPQSGVSISPVTSIGLIYGYVVAIPVWAIRVRRMHDIGESGWIVLISFMPIIGSIWMLVLLCKPSKVEKNPWGLKTPKPLLPFPQVVKLLLIAMLLLYAHDVLEWVVLSTLFQEKSLYLLSVVEDFFRTPYILLRATLWSCWLLGLFHLNKENYRQPSKVVFLLAFILFLLTNVLGQIFNTAQAITGEYDSEPGKVFITVMLLVSLVSVIFRYLSLGMETKKTPALWKVMVSFGLFIVPALLDDLLIVISYFFQEDIYDNIPVFTTYQNFSMLLIILFVIAAIPLLISMIVDRKRVSSTSTPVLEPNIE